MTETIEKYYFIINNIFTILSYISFIITKKLLILNSVKKVRYLHTFE